MCVFILLVSDSSARKSTNQRKRRSIKKETQKKLNSQDCTVYQQRVMNYVSSRLKTVSSESKAPAYTNV